MKTKRILLIRHGESISNKNRVITGRADINLTPFGRVQAKKISLYIKKSYLPIDIIYSSPLKRAFVTATEISKKVKAKVIKDELLLETDFGEWEGKGKDQLVFQPEWEEYVCNPFYFHFPGGESPQDVKHRILTFRETLLNEEKWMNIAIVSHYTPTVFFILTVLGNGNATSAPFRIDTGSLTVIERIDGADIIKLMNYTP